MPTSPGQAAAPLPDSREIACLAVAGDLRSCLLPVSVRVGNHSQCWRGQQRRTPYASPRCLPYLQPRA